MAHARNASVKVATVGVRMSAFGGEPEILGSVKALSALTRSGRWGSVRCERVQKLPQRPISTPLFQ